MSPSPPSSPFALTLCQVGAEPWLKEELARIRPDLRPSYQRPGLLTLRCDGPPFAPTEAPDAVFARMWACARGPVPDEDAVKRVAQEVGARRLWLGPRGQGHPEHTPPPRQQAADEHAAALRESLAPSFDPGEPRPGDVVLDVVTSPGDPHVVGWHVHGPGRHPGPCGAYGITPPEDAPSRAWAKVREALAGSGARIGPRDVVLEIGAAPGGGTRALLDLGAKVVAVDPQPMHPSLRGHPGLVVVRKAIDDVRWEELPLQGVTWLACDAHVAPAKALYAVQRMVVPIRRTLRGLLLTLKLNDQDTVDSLPRVLDQVRALGVDRLWARQVPANRKDVMVVARMARS